MTLANQPLTAMYEDDMLHEMRRQVVIDLIRTRFGTRARFADHVGISRPALSRMLKHLTNDPPPHSRKQGIVRLGFWSNQAPVSLTEAEVSWIYPIAQYISARRVKA